MGMMMHREAYEKLIKEDIEWLKKQKRSLEQEHIICVLENSADRIYGKEIFNLSNPKCGNRGDVPFGFVRIDCEYDDAGVCIHCKEEIPF